MFVWVSNMLLTYQNARDINIHERIYECMYIRKLGYIFAKVYVQFCMEILSMPPLPARLCSPVHRE